MARHRTETGMLTVLRMLDQAHAAGEGIFSYLFNYEVDALPYRLICSHFKESIRTYKWSDRKGSDRPCIHGSVAAWRASFSNLSVANFDSRMTSLTDEDFACLTTITDIRLVDSPYMNGLFATKLPMLVKLTISPTEDMMLMIAKHCPCFEILHAFSMYTEATSTFNGIAACPRLKTLTIQSSQPAGFDAFQGHSIIENLSLVDCKVSDELIHDIANNCPALVDLSISHSELDDHTDITGCESPTDAGVLHLLRMCPRLSRLTVNMSEITDETLLGIPPTVAFLDVSYNNSITDVGVLAVVGTPIYEFRVTNCKGMGDAGILAYHRRFPNIPLLDSRAVIGYRNITDASLPYLGDIDAIIDTDITDAGLDFLQGGRTKLLLHLCDTLTSPGILRTLSMCPKITHVDIRKCCEMNDDFLQQIVHICQSIKCLIVDAVRLTDKGLANWRPLPYLTNLSLLRDDHPSVVRIITDVGLLAIASSCPRLQTLQIRSSEITDAGVISLIHGCRALTCLDVCRTNLTDVSMDAIAKKGAITTLRIDHCSRITDMGVDAVINTGRISYMSFHNINTSRRRRCFITDMPSILSFGPKNRYSTF